MSTTENNSSPATDKNKDPVEAKTATKKTHQPRRSHKKESHHFLLPLVGIILIGGIAGGVWLFQSIKQNHVQQQDAMNVLRGQLQSAQQQAEQQVTALQERLDQQQQAQNELGDNLSTLLKRNEHLRKDWLLGEAEYLIKLASYRLQLERDVTTALRAMQAADERLRDVGDPALLSVRKILAEDQNALKNVPSADITGMSLTLSALINNIDKLPLNTPTPKSVQQPQTQTDDSKDIKNWKELPNAIWQDIKGLVTIRQHNDKIATLLSPKEHFYLLQNLRLQLEQARLALLLGKANVFDERMQAAQNWLTRFFDPEDAGVQNTLQTLTQLSKTNIEPEIPSISKSYDALKSYLAGVPLKKIEPKKSDEQPPVTKSPPKKPESKPPAAKTKNATQKTVPVVKPVEKSDKVQ